jgi:hypothetical protein
MSNSEDNQTNQATDQSVDNSSPSDKPFADNLNSLSDEAIQSFNADSFGRIVRLSKIELITIIAASSVSGVAHGACACGY